MELQRIASRGIGDYQQRPSGLIAIYCYGHR
jgi:hypothetical protein